MKYDINHPEYPLGTYPYPKPMSEQKELDRPEFDADIRHILVDEGINWNRSFVISKQILALVPDTEELVARLKQAVRDAKDGKDIDLPEELYEVFCSIQNQAIIEAYVRLQELEEG